MKKMSFKSFIFLAFTLFSFSSIEVFSKPFVGKVDPFFMTFFRFLIGGTVLLLFAKSVPSKEDLLWLTLIGGLNSIISMTSLQLAVKFSNASTAATLVASNPVFVALLSLVFLKEKFSIKKIFGIALGIFGLFVFSSGMVIGDSLLGIFFGITASITFALYTILMRQFSQKYDPLIVTGYSALLSSFVYGLLLVATGNFVVPVLSLNGWFILLYFGVIVTGFAYVTYFEAMKEVGPTQASRIFFLKPAVAMLLAVLILGEMISPLKLIGFGIILVSLLL